jgi:hypothetical protein
MEGGSVKYAGTPGENEMYTRGERRGHEAEIL